MSCNTSLYNPLYISPSIVPEVNWEHNIYGNVKHEGIQMSALCTLHVMSLANQLWWVLTLAVTCLNFDSFINHGRSWMMHAQIQPKHWVSVNLSAHQFVNHRAHWPGCLVLRINAGQIWIHDPFSIALTLIYYCLFIRLIICNAWSFLLKILHNIFGPETKYHNRTIKVIITTNEENCIVSSLLNQHSNRYSLCSKL